MNELQVAIYIFVKYGVTKHPLYSIYGAIRARCNNKNNTQYHYYGGRGITMCKEWADDPESFVLWLIDNGIAGGLTIDRRDNDKGYSPDNCRLVDMVVQNNNRRLYKNNTLGVRGVAKTKSGKYQAMVKTGGKCLHVGVYTSITEASKARDRFINENNLMNKKALEE